MGVNDYIVARFRLNCKEKAEPKQVTYKTLKQSNHSFHVIYHRLKKISLNLWNYSRMTMRALWNEGTVSFSLFRHINKHSGINFVKTKQTVLVGMT